MIVARQYKNVLIFLKSPFGILLYCSLLVFTPLSTAQVDSQRSLSSAREDQDYTFAFGLYTDKLYELAGEQFDSFIQKYPTSIRRSDALFLRSECSYFMKEYAGAVAGYTSFLSEYPSSELSDDALFRIGQAELSRNRFEESASSFKIVIDEHPQSPLAGESAYWLGEAYDRSGDLKNAVKYFTLSYEHFAGNPYKDYAMYAVGWAYQKEGRFPEARTAYELLVASAPESTLLPAAQVRIGECLFSGGGYQAAIDHLAPLMTRLEKPALVADAEYTMAESYYLLGEYAAAGSRFKHLLSSSPEHARYDDALYGLGWTYLKTEQFDSAARVFGVLAGRGGNRSHEARYRRAFALRQAGSPDSARTLYLQLAELDPQGALSDEALVDAADLSLRSGDHAAARTLAERVLAEYPESNVRGDAYWMLGEIALSAGTPAEARPFFLEAVKGPASGREIIMTASFRAAISAFRLGVYDTAATEFAAFRAKFSGHPKVPEAAYWQAEAEYKRGRFPQARGLYGEAVRSLSGTLKNDALYGLGWASYKEGRFADAVEAFGLLIAEAGRGTIEYDARMRQADALFAMRSYQRAEQAYRSVVRLYPDTTANDVARYQAAQCAFRREDLPGAYAQFTELVKLMPSSPLADDAQYAMGWINFRRKEYADAIKDFQVVIRSFPNGDVVSRAYYSLGDGYYNLKQYGPAERSYRDVITLFPESQYVPDAITGLQYCLIAQGKDDEAVRVIDEFLAQHSGSPSAQALLLKKAELLYGKDELKAARDAYTSFLGAYPSSSLKGEALYWLGKTESQTGNTNAAFMAFRDAWGFPGTYRGLAFLEALDAAIVLGQTEEALSLILSYERSMAPSDIKAEVAYRKGKLFAAEGNEAEAQGQYELVVVNYSTEDAAYRSRIALARIALDQQDNERARLLALEVSGSRTDDLGAEGQFLVAQTYVREEQWRDAATAFLRVKYVFPSSREWNDRSALGLASAYRSLGEMEKARQTLREFLKGSPDAALRSQAESLLKELGG